MALFQELRRRNVFRVAATYAIVAWLLIQIAVSVFPTLQLPDWTTTLVTVLLITGFPMALVLAWAFELTPDGIRRSVNDKAANKTGQGAGLFVDIALIASLVLVGGIMLMGQLRTSESARPSIAVLPFADMSPDGDQEYFGDGIADELLNELAGIGGIDVESRTSSFAYKDSTLSITEIGNALGVATILEGSVRKNADTLRVTAQLIDVDTGNHLWSEVFDREFTDIFSVQESIAREVAAALGVQLGAGSANAFRGAGTRNVEAYELFLQSLLQASIQQKIDLLEQAVALDSNYAAAWAELGLATVAQVWTVLPDDSAIFVDEGIQFVRRAIELDPLEASAHTQLGTMLYTGNNWSEGQRAHDNALRISYSAVGLQQNMALLMRAGRMTAAIERWPELTAIESSATAIDELSPFHILVLLALRRFEEAQDLISDLPQSDRAESQFLLALSTGSDDEVRAALREIRTPPIAVTRLYTPVLERFENRQEVIEFLRELDADPIDWPSKWYDTARIAAWAGDAPLALEIAGRAARFGSPRRFILWMPFMAQARTLPAFRELVRDINLEAYWREYGWSDFCQPISDTEFVCS